MPSWLPGDDYMTNFKKGDPYVRVDDGYARLPGAGYEALHPELKGVNPEEYPDIHKLRILADVAPYSREYNQGSPSCLTQKTLAHARQAQAPCRIRISSALRLSPGLLPALPFYRERARETMDNIDSSTAGAIRAPFYSCNTATYCATH